MKASGLEVTGGFLCFEVLFFSALITEEFKREFPYGNYFTAR